MSELWGKQERNSWGRFCNMKGKVGEAANVVCCVAKIGKQKSNLRIQRVGTSGSASFVRLRRDTN